MPHRATRRTLGSIIAVILVAILLAATGSAAISTTYGKIVDKKTNATDPNTVIFHTTILGEEAIIRATDDATGSKDWYLKVGADTTKVQSGDLRLNTMASPFSFSAGTRVKTGDGDIGRDLNTAGVLCYLPTYTTSSTKNFRGTDRFNPDHPESTFVPSGEPLYVKTACGTVQAGADQVRITGTPSSNPSLGGHSAGSRVVSGNTDLGNTTVSLVGHHANARFRFYDIDNSGGISNVDPIYLSLEGDTAAQRPQPGDVRLFDTSTYSVRGGYGSHVRIDDFDAAKTLMAMPTSTRIAYVDHDSSNPTVPGCSSSTLQNSLYLDVGGTNAVANGDVRIFTRSGGTGTSGSIVRADSADLLGTLINLAAFLRYADYNGNGVFDHGDGLYLDTGGGSADGVVGVGDIRLYTSSFGAVGSCVVSGNSDVGQPLLALPADNEFRFLDAWNANAYQPGNPVYFGPTGDVAMGHVRMTGLFSAFGSHGSVVGETSQDRTYSLTTLSANPAICFSPSSGTTYRPEDAVYLAWNNSGCTTNNLRAGDVRLSGTGTLAAGTTVRGGDHDFNHPLQPLSNARFRYAESGQQSGTFDPNDFVYLKVGDTSPGDTTVPVAVGDVRITARSGSTAGTKVASGDSDLSESLRNFPTTFNVDKLKFMKQAPPSGTTFSAGYTAHDIVVYDTNNNGFLDIGDIILVGSGGTTSLTGSSPTSPTSPTAPATTPTASFTTTVDGRMVVANAVGSSATSGRSITNYAWDFGDGHTVSGANLVQGTRTYDSEGQYTIRLTVTDSAGETGTTTRTIQTDGYVPPEIPPDPEPEPEPEPGPEPGPEPEPEPEEESTPGPAVVVGFVILVAAVVALRRRK